MIGKSTLDLLSSFFPRWKVEEPSCMESRGEPVDCSK